MAANLNKVFLMGNLTRDPDLRQMPSGDTVAELGLAVSEQFRSRTSNELREVVTFVDITVWGKVAENCGKYLTKGRPVFVEGRLVLDTWDDKTTGQKRSRLRVRADRVQFLYANVSTRRDMNGAAMGSDWAPAPANPVPAGVSARTAPAAYAAPAPAAPAPAAPAAFAAPAAPAAFAAPAAPAAPAEAVAPAEKSDLEDLPF